MITWITENIAIGEYLDACNREVLLANKIDCIVDLRIEKPLGAEILARQNNIAYFHLPVGSSEENIKRELRCAYGCLMVIIGEYHYKRILVHCTAGIDRSRLLKRKGLK